MTLGEYLEERTEESMVERRLLSKDQTHVRSYFGGRIEALLDLSGRLKPDTLTHELKEKS